MRINLDYARAFGQGIVRNILQTSERKLRRNIQKRKSKKHHNWQKIPNKFVFFNGSWCNVISYVARFLAVKGCVTSQKGTACNSRLGYVTNGVFEFCRCVNKFDFNNDFFTKRMLQLSCEPLLKPWCIHFSDSNNKTGALEIPGKILRPGGLYLCLPVKCGKWRP